MQGEPGPAPAEPRLERIAMRPMLAHEIGKGELALDRDQRPHERPADKDRDPRRCKRDGLGTAIRSMPTGHAAYHSSAPLSRSRPRARPVTASAALASARRIDSAVGLGEIGRANV